MVQIYVFTNGWILLQVQVNSKKGNIGMANKQRRQDRDGLVIMAM